MIRRASGTDLDRIVALRAEASGWLRDLGSDQWDNSGLDTDSFATRVLESIQAGETWVIEEGGQVLATIAIDSHSDPGLWSDEELKESLIIHRMMTARSATGRGLGQLLIHLARHLAYHAGKRYVRLDAWNSNSGLHAYYEHAGFQYLRTSTDHGTPSGTLYEIKSKDFSDVDEIARAVA